MFELTMLIENIADAESRIPVSTIILEPILSKNLPVTGEHIAEARTTGKSIKLALEEFILNIFTAKFGIKIMDDWKIPVPIAIMPTSRICRA